MWAIQWWGQSEEGGDRQSGVGWPFLVATAKKLKIMILDKDSHSTDVFYHQRCSDKFTRDYKPVESNREDKNSVEKATAEKMFLALLKTQVLNQKSCFFLRDSMAVK